MHLGLGTMTPVYISTLLLDRSSPFHYCSYHGTVTVHHLQSYT
jgi:hypothetical protein